MSIFISGFLSWVLHSFLLSALVYGVYVGLVRSHGKARFRYLFLKLAFLSLPFQYFAFSEFYSSFSMDEVVNQPVFQTALKASSVPEHSVEIGDEKAKVILDAPPLPKTSYYWGWIALLAFFLYGAVVLWKLLVLSRSLWRMRTLYRGSHSQSFLNCPDVYTHSSRVGPMIYGFLRPAVLLPQFLLNELDPRELNLVIQHERLHGESKDFVVNFFRLLVKDVLFFSPFVRSLAKAMEKEMELTVDEKMVKEEGVDRRAYGALLLKLYESHFQLSPVGRVGLPSSLLVDRIRQLKNLGAHESKNHAIVVAVLSLFVLGTALPSLGLEEKTNVALPAMAKMKSEAAAYCPDGKCPKDFRKIFEGAHAGNMKDQVELGKYFHRMGSPIKKNYDMAMKWYMAAYDQGSGEAANLLGRIFWVGDGAFRDRNIACFWYLRSAELGWGLGMNNLSHCYRAGREKNFKKDPKKAEYWMRKAQNNLGPGFGPTSLKLNDPMDIRYGSDDSIRLIYRDSIGIYTTRVRE